MEEQYFEISNKYLRDILNRCEFTSYVDGVSKLVLDDNDNGVYVESEYNKNSDTFTCEISMIIGSEDLLVLLNKDQQEIVYDFMMVNVNNNEEALNSCVNDYEQFNGQKA